MKEAAEIIAVMFVSREQAHRAHLLTNSRSDHEALDGFYKGIIKVADRFAEVFKGIRPGELGSIPYKLAVAGRIDDALEKHMRAIESLRDALKDKRDRPLQNIIDEALALYGATIGFLRDLS